MLARIDPTAAGKRFQSLFGKAPAVVASAPGRLEVLGNHTDYNAGLTLSCAVGFRCFAGLSKLDEPVVRLASTAFETTPQTFALDSPGDCLGHWANYVLGLLAALRRRGHDVTGFELLVDSEVPPSAGLSSSAALEMSVLLGLMRLMGLQLPPIELTRIGQEAESSVVGAQTGLLDQLSSLLGQRDRLIATDFKTFDTQLIALPAGWCFVAIDSGVKHDLTEHYNDRRESCEAAAGAMGVLSLRDADEQLLESGRSAMAGEAWRCAAHVLGENRRVSDAVSALGAGDIERLGGLMFASHRSSRDDLQNSCPELDAIVRLAEADPRCIGARLSGGGFGGITIHLVRREDAEDYRQDMLRALHLAGGADRWSAVCEIDSGAVIHAV